LCQIRAILEYRVRQLRLLNGVSVGVHKGSDRLPTAQGGGCVDIDTLAQLRGREAMPATLKRQAPEAWDSLCGSFDILIPASAQSAFRAGERLFVAGRFASTTSNRIGANALVCGLVRGGGGVIVVADARCCDRVLRRRS
jgi:hypothetical protein